MRLGQRLLEWGGVCLLTWLAVLLWDGRLWAPLSRLQQLLHLKGSQIRISGVHAPETDPLVQEVSAFLARVQETVQPQENIILAQQRQRKWFHSAIDLADKKLRLYWPKHPADYCSGEAHFATAFSCLAAEARFLERVLVLRSTVCMAPEHNGGRFAVRPFEAYYELYGMKKYLPWVLEDDLSLALQEQRRARPSIRMVGPSAGTRDLNREHDATILVRDLTGAGWSYGFDVCQLPRTPLKLKGLLNPNKQLQAIVKSICDSMSWDFDAVHVRRGDKLDPLRWPNLDRDTRPEALLKQLRRRILPGRHVYIATDETTPGYFDNLRAVYKVHLLEDYHRLWGKHSTWYNWTEAMFGQAPIFDSRMKVIVDYKVKELATIQVHTFNDLTTDPKLGTHQNWSLHSWDAFLKPRRDAGTAPLAKSS